MTHAEDKPRAPDTQAPDGWVRRNLLALGSVAIVAVYTAGYVRTKPAADRFAEEAAHRRRPPQPHPFTAAAPATTAGPSATVPATKTKPDTTSQTTTTKPPAKAVAKAPAPKKVPKPAAETLTNVAKATVPVESTSAPPPAVAPVTPPVAPPVAADTTKPSAPPVDSSSKAAAKWKDGSYAAWGYSRHGDLEATIEIRDGRIISATITQCWTRYPCSRIAPLPPQVVERQSEDVDSVSRATESADAFYYAVKQALAKAKP